MRVRTTAGRCPRSALPRAALSLRRMPYAAPATVVAGQAGTDGRRAGRLGCQRASGPRIGQSPVSRRWPRRGPLHVGDPLATSRHPSRNHDKREPRLRWRAAAPRRLEVRVEPLLAGGSPTRFPSLRTCVRGRSARSVTWSCGPVRSSAEALEPWRMRPELRPARPRCLRVFKSIRDSQLAAVATWAFIRSACLGDPRSSRAYPAG
jgi:hypothetical protein